MIEKIRSVTDWAGPGDDQAEYVWLLLDGDEYDASCRSRCPEHYREHEDFWRTTVRTVIRDAEAAKRLNNMGYGNWRQEPFTYRKVRRLRCDYKLCSRYERLRARGLLTTAEMAKRMGVCTATVHHWGCRGMLQREIYGGHHCLYLPPDPRTFVRPTIGRPCSAGSGRNDRST